MAELPDVRVGDVWRDDYPGGRFERTVTVDHICPAGTFCMVGSSGPPHVHVTSNAGRKTVIAQRRFKPGTRGYSLISRKAAR